MRVFACKYITSIGWRCRALQMSSTGACNVPVPVGLSVPASIHLVYSNRYKNASCCRVIDFKVPVRWTTTLQRQRATVSCGILQGLTQQANLSTPSSNTNNASNSQRKWWHTTLEFKIMLSLAFAALSYLSSKYYKRHQAVIGIQLEHVNQQMKQLYGPLYGNRLIEKKTYQAVMAGQGGLRKYLGKAHETKDPEMVRIWRSFVLDVLYPLDKEAETLILKNSHLIVDREFPQAFDGFLSHIAQLKFLMERWKKADGSMEASTDYTPEDYLYESNASGGRAVEEMLEHVESRYKELKEIQTKLKMEAHLEVDSSQTFDSLISKIIRIR